jgi:hypothetical protein
MDTFIKDMYGEAWFVHPSRLDTVIPGDLPIKGYLADEFRFAHFYLITNMSTLTQYLERRSTLLDAYDTSNKFLLAIDSYKEWERMQEKQEECNKEEITNKLIIEEIKELSRKKRKEDSSRVRGYTNWDEEFMKHEESWFEHQHPKFERKCGPRSAEDLEIFISQGLPLGPRAESLVDEALLLLENPDVVASKGYVCKSILNKLRTYMKRLQKKNNISIEKKMNIWYMHCKLERCLQSLVFGCMMFIQSCEVQTMKEVLKLYKRTGKYISTLSF